MALITSKTLKPDKEEPVADQKTADKDIIVENEAGQSVLVVAAGQPIPDDLDERKRLAGVAVSRNASDEEVDEARGIETKRSNK